MPRKRKQLCRAEPFPSSDISTGQTIYDTFDDEKRMI